MSQDQHLPIALASIFGKYIRELLMICFNAFWQARLPDLKPTAGYYQDALRFLADIKPAMTSLGTDRAILVREL